MKERGASILRAGSIIAQGREEGKGSFAVGVCVRAASYSGSAITRDAKDCAENLFGIVRRERPQILLL
jgi:hypothetical protein